MVGLLVLSVLTIVDLNFVYGESPNKAAPIRVFKIVWGLPTGAEDPQIEVIDNQFCPAMADRHRVRGREHRHRWALF